MYSLQLLVLYIHQKQIASNDRLDSDRPPCFGNRQERVFNDFTRRSVPSLPDVSKTKTEDKGPVGLRFTPVGLRFRLVGLRSSVFVFGSSFSTHPFCSDSQLLRYLVFVY